MLATRTSESHHLAEREASDCWSIVSATLFSKNQMKWREKREIEMHLSEHFSEELKTIMNHTVRIIHESLNGSIMLVEMIAILDVGGINLGSKWHIPW
jgi:erythromycin esterase-like protein